MNKIEKWIIIKKMNLKGIEVPIIIIDDLDEVMEFDSPEEATKIKEIFQNNSDSGHKYEIKKI
jgi:hypothetical protein